MAAATFPEEDSVDAGGEDLLEYEFLELMIANDRVVELLHQIREAKSAQRKRQAVFDLAEIVEKGPTFANEAAEEGAVGILTLLLKQGPEDEQLVRVACKIINACSGTVAHHGIRVQDFAYGPVTVRLREASLVDGLGNRVWAVAHSLCRYLVENADLVRGRSVLEIGAGTGLCGLVAARLAASEVVLTDYLETVLLNLRECVVLNAAELCQQKSSAGSPTSKATATDEAISNEDVREDKIQRLLWDWGSVHVRHLDWSKDRDMFRAASMGNGFHAAGGMDGQEAAAGGRAPELGASDTFDIVLGSDICYEVEHASMIAAVLTRRLRRHGIGLIALAVRDQGLCDELLKQIQLLGLHVDKRQVQPCEENPGILGREKDYEGGFVMLTVSQAK